MYREVLQSPKTKLLQILFGELPDEGDRTSAPELAKKRKAYPYGGHCQPLFESELTQLLNTVKRQGQTCLPQLAHDLYSLSTRSTPRRDRAAAMGRCQLRSGRNLYSPPKGFKVQHSHARWSGV